MMQGIENELVMCLFMNPFKTRKMATSKKFSVLVKFIISLFASLKGSKFVGIKAYQSKTSGEIADHIVIANFSYDKAVKNDLKKLQKITIDQKAILIKKGYSNDMINEAIQKLTDAFIKNQNPETRSAQSQAQIDAYLKITSSIKLHIESGLLYIYALSHSKHIIEEGNYKTVNSRPLTLCQNDIKKILDFRTSKFRQFIIQPEQLAKVNISGESISL